MSENDGLHTLIEELEHFNLNPNSYQDDSGYISFIDNLLTGKVRALRAHLRRLGQYQLFEELNQLSLGPGEAITVLEQLSYYFIPEIKKRMEATADDSVADQDFWLHVHPKIASVARGRFREGTYADAAEASLKEVNAVVKGIVIERTGSERDGADLMQHAFSTGKPVIKLADLSTESGRSEQKGYMQIFAGAMTGIRNPKAHENIQINREKAVHFIYLASLLMHKLDEALAGGAR